MNSHPWDPSLDHVDTEALALDTNHSILAHRYRRWTLARLDSATMPLHVADLARDLAALDAEERADAHDPCAISIMLYHTHLPRLEDAGIVDFDADARLASLTASGSMEQKPGRS